MDDIHPREREDRLESRALDPDDDAAERPQDRQQRDAGDKDDAGGDAGRKHDDAHKRTRWPLIALAILIILAVIVGTIYWWLTKDEESTDDAFTDGRAILMAPHVSGYVAVLAINDNQRVHKGDLLLEIERRDYVAAREQAAGQLAAIQAQLDNARVALDKARTTAPAQLTQAEGQLTQAARSYTIGPSLTMPIFEGGRLTGNLELAKAQQQEAAITYQRTVLNAWQEVATALAAYAAEQRRRDELARAVAQNRRALALARQQYGQGLADFLRVLTAQQQLLASEQQTADSTTTVSTNLVALYLALGGGWAVPAPEQETRAMVE